MTFITMPGLLTKGVLAYLLLVFSLGTLQPGDHHYEPYEEELKKILVLDGEGVAVWVMWALNFRA